MHPEQLLSGRTRTITCKGRFSSLFFSFFLITAQFSDFTNGNRTAKVLDWWNDQTYPACQPEIEFGILSKPTVCVQSRCGDDSLARCSGDGIGVQWRHFAVIYSNANSSLYFYENGHASGSTFQNVSFNTDTECMRIAQKCDNGNQQFLGLLNEIRIFNTVLTEVRFRLLLQTVWAICRTRL